MTHQPGVYVPLRALFLVHPEDLVYRGPGPSLDHIRGLDILLFYKLLLSHLGDKNTNFSLRILVFCWPWFISGKNWHKSSDNISNNTFQSISS